jgi:hypothetical protein
MPRPLPLAIALLTACGPTPAGPGSTTEPSTSDITTTEPATTTADPTTGPTATTADTTTTAGPTTTESTTTESQDFVPRPDTGNLPFQCDVFKQDCDPGQKCTAWRRRAAAAPWNATKCVDVTGDGAPGDPCTATGGGVSGIDDCALGVMCWDVDEDNHGTCIALCYRHPGRPVCPLNSTCAVSPAKASSTSAFPSCDPLIQDCPGRRSLHPEPTANSSLRPRRLGRNGRRSTTPANSPTPATRASSASNTFRRLERLRPSKVLPGCCQPFCKFPDSPCPNPDQECLQWYDPMAWRSPRATKTSAICGHPGVTTMRNLHTLHSRCLLACGPTNAPPLEATTERSDTSSTTEAPPRPRPPPPAETADHHHPRPDHPRSSPPSTTTSTPTTTERRTPSSSSPTANATGQHIQCDVFEQDCDPGQKCIPWAEGWRRRLERHQMCRHHRRRRPRRTLHHRRRRRQPASTIAPWAVPCAGTSTPRTVTASASGPVHRQPRRSRYVPRRPSCLLAISKAILNLCLPDCDPLLQDCPGDNLCIPTGDKFTCVLDASGEMGAGQRPLRIRQRLRQGPRLPQHRQRLDRLRSKLLRAAASPSANSRASPCPNPDQQCLQWLDPMRLRDPSLATEDIGVCAHPGVTAMRPITKASTSSQPPPCSPAARPRPAPRRPPPPNSSRAPATPPSPSALVDRPPPPRRRPEPPPPSPTTAQTRPPVNHHTTTTGNAQDFILKPDGAAPLRASIECDIFAQDCDPGQKCAPWAEGGGPVLERHQMRRHHRRRRPGRPLHRPRAAASCRHRRLRPRRRCAGTSTPSNQGTCVAMCTGTPRRTGMCPPQEIECLYHRRRQSSTSASPDCDPLLQDCGATTSASPAGRRISSVSSTPPATMGIGQRPLRIRQRLRQGPRLPRHRQRLERLRSMAPRAAASPSASSPGSPCPNPDQECLPWFDPMMQVPPGYEDVGFCGIPEADILARFSSPRYVMRIQLARSHPPKHSW